MFRGHTRDVSCFAFSHNGKLLASGSDDETIRMWDVETGETVLSPLKGHTCWVYCVAFSPDDRRIVSGSYDFTVRIWDAQTGEPLHELKEHRLPVISVAFSFHGSNVVSSDRKHEILIRDVESTRCVCYLETNKHWAFDLHFSVDDKFTAGVQENELTVWDVESGKRMPTSLQAGSFGDLVWFRYHALYTCMNGEIRRWSTREASILDYDSVLSPDRKWIASPGIDFDVYLYSRDPSSEELASVDDIEDILRRL